MISLLSQVSKLYGAYGMQAGSQAPAPRAQAAQSRPTGTASPEPATGEVDPKAPRGTYLDITA